MLGRIKARGLYRGNLKWQYIEWQIMIKSPCVRICALNESGICVGCGMCIRDLRIWRSTDDQTREKIVTESRDRLRSMQELRDEGFLQDDEN